MACFNDELFVTTNGGVWCPRWFDVIVWCDPKGVVFAQPTASTSMARRGAFGFDGVCDGPLEVLSRRHGKGRAIYLPWLPEWLYFRDGMTEHRELLLQLIGQASTPPVKLTGAGPIEVTVRATRDGAGDLVVHLVNYAGQRGSAYEEPPAIGGLRLGVKDAGPSAKALVAGQAIAVGAPDAEGYAWLDVPPVGPFEIVVLPQAGA